jgi:DNA-binding MarR family transcriptional regulator
MYKNGLLYLGLVSDYLSKNFPRFPIQYLRCLLIIHANPGVKISDVSKTLDLPLSTTSRIISALENKRQVGEAYQFVKILVNKENRREKQLYLTDKGMQLINRVENL